LVLLLLAFAFLFLPRVVLHLELSVVFACSVFLLSFDLLALVRHDPIVFFISSASIICSSGEELKFAGFPQRRI